MCCRCLWGGRVYFRVSAAVKIKSGDQSYLTDQSKWSQSQAWSYSELCLTLGVGILFSSSFVTSWFTCSAGGPDHDRLGFRYWKHPGPFVQFDGIGGAKGRFLGFWAVLTQAAFSYIGTEIVAVSPSLSHRCCLHNIFRLQQERLRIQDATYRELSNEFIYVSVNFDSPDISVLIIVFDTGILLFYILGTFVIGLLVPSNDPALNLKTTHGTAGASPFVIAISRSGIKSLPSVRVPMCYQTAFINLILDYQCLSSDFGLVCCIERPVH